MLRVTDELVAVELDAVALSLDAVPLVEEPFDELDELADFDEAAVLKEELAVELVLTGEALE